MLTDRTILLKGIHLQRGDSISLESWMAVPLEISSTVSEKCKFKIFWRVNEIIFERTIQSDMYGNTYRHITAQKRVKTFQYFNEW